MTSSWRHNIPVLGWPFRLNNLKLLDPKIESSLGGWYSRPFLLSKNIISALEKPFNLKLILIMISMLCHIFFDFSKNQDFRKFCNFSEVSSFDYRRRWFLIYRCDQRVMFCYVWPFQISTHDKIGRFRPQMTRNAVDFDRMSAEKDIESPNCSVRSGRQTTHSLFF